MHADNLPLSWVSMKDPQTRIPTAGYRRPHPPGPFHRGPCPPGGKSHFRWRKASVPKLPPLIPLPICLGSGSLYSLKRNLAAPPARDRDAPSFPSAQQRYKGSSSHGFCIPGLWRRVAWEHKGPLIFPSSISKRQGGPDACGFKLLNSNEVSPARSCPACTPAQRGPLLTRAPCARQCQGRARVHQAPWELLTLLTTNLFCIKTPEATRDP